MLFIGCTNVWHRECFPTEHSAYNSCFASLKSGAQNIVKVVGMMETGNVKLPVDVLANILEKLVEINEALEDGINTVTELSSKGLG